MSHIHESYPWVMSMSHLIKSSTSQKDIKLRVLYTISRSWLVNSLNIFLRCVGLYISVLTLCILSRWLLIIFCFCWIWTFCFCNIVFRPENWKFKFDLQLKIGSRRWNWKFRKFFLNPDTELLLYSSYSFWP